MKTGGQVSLQNDRDPDRDYASSFSNRYAAFGLLTKGPPTGRTFLP